VLVAVVNDKGGCGKTTLATAIAETGARYWERALLCDLDAQGSAARWAQLAGSRGHPLEASAVVLNVRPSDLAARLANLRAETYPLVVLDLGPGDPKRIGAAVALADLVVIPSRPTPADLDRTWRILDLAETAERPAIVVATMVRAGTVALAAARDAMADAGAVLATTVLPLREAIARSFGYPIRGELATFGETLLAELVAYYRKVSP